MIPFISTSCVSKSPENGVPLSILEYDKETVGSQIILFVNVGTVFPNLAKNDLTIELWSNGKKMADTDCGFYDALRTIENKRSVITNSKPIEPNPIVQIIGTFKVAINGNSLDELQKIVYELRLVDNGTILDSSKASFLIVSV